MKNYVGFRLRKGIDDDIRKAIAVMGSGDLSEKARDGLRWALGFGTTKRIEVTERPLQTTFPGKAVVWTPKKKG